MMLNMKIRTFFIVVICSMLSAQSHAASTKESIEAINQRLARIEQILQSQGLLDMLQQLESLQQELSQLRGEIEVQNHTVEQVNKRQRALYTDIDQRIQRLESNGVPNVAVIGDTPTTEIADPSNPPLQTLAPVVADRQTTAAQQTDRPLTVELVNSEPAASVQEPVSESTSVTNIETPVTETSTIAEPEVAKVIESNPIQARTDYQQAFRLLKQSLYDQAIKAFNEFLTIHPNSDYSDNAQYWLAEAYYVTRQFDQALVEYDKLVVNYPESQKLTHALLKIGYSHHELGKLEQAKTLLEDLKMKYPGTTAARLADDRLKKIRIAQQENAAN